MTERKGVLLTIVSEQIINIVIIFNKIPFFAVNVLSSEMTVKVK